MSPPRRTPIPGLRWRNILLALLASASLPGSAASLPPGLADLMDEGEIHQYNLQFDRAMATFQRMCREYPTHPAGYAMHGAAIWWQARYWYRTPDRAAAKLMENKLEKAIELARVMVQDPETRCEGRFFLGGSLGVRAHWKLLTGHLFRSVLSARAAVKVLRPLLSCTDFGDEAHFGLGLYEYVASRLPWHKRWMSKFIIGGGTDRESAFARLEHAATHAKFIRHDAQFTLTMFLTLLDLDSPRAMKHAVALVTERPNSPVAHALYAQVLCYDGRYDEALRETDRNIAVGQAAGSPFKLDELAYRYYRGVSLLGLQRVSEAIEEFTRAAAIVGPPAWMTGSCLLRGFAHDLAGNRALALADYRRARTMKDPWEQVKRARPFMDRPCTWADFHREFPRREEIGPRNGSRTR